MPTGTASLIINLAQDEVRDYNGDSARPTRFAGAVLVGVRSRFAVIDADEQVEVMGVEFRPGGTWPFIDAAAEEFQNDHAALGDVWGSSGATLRERLLAEMTIAGKIRLLEAALFANCVRPIDRTPMVTAALNLLHAARAPQIADIANELGVNARKLTRTFAVEVGLTPKLYARVLRFQRVLESSYPVASVDWTTLAVDHGYFDQAHFIRDFKEISGYTPTQYFARRTPFSNHVPHEII